MSNRSATSYLRVTEDRKTPCCKPVDLSKGRRKPHCAMSTASPSVAPKVSYVRVGRECRKQKFFLVGNDPYIALDKLAKKGVGCGIRELGIP